MILLFCAFFSVSETKAIYRQTLNTSVTLNVTTNTYRVTFHTEGGTPNISPIDYPVNQPLGTLPTAPTRVGYRFDGWFTDNVNYTNEITTSTVITGDMDAYAKWTDLFPTVFSQTGACTFNGKNSNITGSECSDYTDKKYIDTGIALFNSENYLKDFEVGFTIVSYNSNAQEDMQSTFFDAKLENKTSNYPGFVVRKRNAGIQLTQRIGSVMEEVDFQYTANMNIKVMRINNAVYYSVNGGPLVFFQDTTGFNQQFNLTSWFGAYAMEGDSTVTGENSTADRYIKATMSNMYIKLGQRPNSTANITYNGEGGTPSLASETKVVGTTYGQLPTSTKTGFIFDGWYTEASGGTKITENTVVTGDITLHAQYFPAVTISFNAEGGTSSLASTEIITGSTLGSVLNEMPTATKTGFTFDGWYTEASGGTLVTLNTAFNATTTLHAHWISTVVVTFDGEGGTPSFSSKNVGVGTAVGELPTATKANFILTGWYTEASGGTKITESTIINSAITFHAQYLPASTITYEGDGATLSFNSKLVATGTAAGEFPTATKTGYIFDGWYADSSFNTPVTTSTIITEDTIFYIKWIDDRFAATINGVGYATVQLAVDSITNSDETEILLIKNFTNPSTGAVATNRVTIPSGRNIIINFQGFSLSNGVDAPVIENNGTLKLYGGTINCSANQGAVNNNAGGNLVIEDMTINETGSRQALYNKGTAEIKGNSTLTSNATQRATVQNDAAASVLIISSGTIIAENASCQRGAVQNASGSLTVLGGTIISKSTNNASGGIQNAGTLVIGEEGGGVSTTSPIIQGKKYGVNSSKDYSFFDGILKGETAATNDNSKITTWETGYDKTAGNDSPFYTLYLAVQTPQNNIINPNFSINSNTNSTNSTDLIGPLPLESIISNSEDEEENTEDNDTESESNKEDEKKEENN